MRCTSLLRWHPIVVFERIRVVSDSNVARCQINALRASVHADSQQRILRRLFWLRCWSTVSVESFRVPSFLNAADPLSRETGFQSRKQAIAEAARRREMWERAVDTKYVGLMEMIRPPVEIQGGGGGLMTRRLRGTNGRAIARQNVLSVE